jgi:LPXTG-site transpeptidase (sortase) family protein
VNKKYWIILGVTLVIATGVFFIIWDRNKQTEINFHASNLSDLKNGTETGSETSNISQSNNSSNEASGSGSTSGYKLTIDKLGISAPVSVNIDGNNKNDYLKALENGIAHMKNTALPGAIGNTVLFGHSSYYANKPGSYKDIFAKLNNLGIGDIIKVSNDNTVYNYKVVEKKIIGSKDLSVITSANTGQTLTVLTCWPVGTIDQRLVVKATVI